MPFNQSKVPRFAELRDTVANYVGLVINYVHDIWAGSFYVGQIYWREFQRTPYLFLLFSNNTSICLVIPLPSYYYSEFTR
jgi:hypothetical protein